jgi:hypothetical protein
MSAATGVDRELVRRARAGIDFFARVLTGEELWPHQVALASSVARIVAACIGRQAGKSRTLAVLALWHAWRSPGFRVLVLSAGEDAAKDLLAEIARLAGSPLLAGSVVDSTASTITLSNGSTIRCVPQSEKQVRGKSIDLLILDEAAYIDEEIWRAARYTILARPGSRVFMCSTPRGRRDRFFATHYHLARPGEGAVEHAAGVSVESFHWPSTVSPLVDEELVEFWRQTDDPRVFRREVLAEWVDEAGQFFTAEELDSNVAPFVQIDPEAARGAYVVGGVDWASRVDSNALAMIGVLGRHGYQREPVFCVAHARERRGSMNEWARDVARWVDPHECGFEAHSLASELNGVGQAPTELLGAELRERGMRPWTVRGVWTTNARKANGFGQVKLLLQQGRLVLPADPTLRRQLEALEFTTSESGNTSIAVPASKGHDDLAMALCQAMSCVRHVHAGPSPDDLAGKGEVLTTAAGAAIYEHPRLAWHRRAFQHPAGSEDGEKGW